MCHSAPVGRLTRSLIGAIIAGHGKLEHTHPGPNGAWRTGLAHGGLVPCPAGLSTKDLRPSGWCYPVDTALLLHRAVIAAARASPSDASAASHVDPDSSADRHPYDTTHGSKPDSHALPYIHSHGHSPAGTQCHLHTHSQRHADSYAYAIPNPHADGNPHANQHAHAHPHANRHEYTHQHGHTNRYQYAHTNCHRHGHAVGYQHTDLYPNSHRHTDAHPNPYLHADADAHGHGHPHPHRHANCDPDYYCGLLVGDRR